MSRMLAELLGVNEMLLSADVACLERASGLPSHDVRLQAEMIGKVHRKTRELGLDPRDTTGEELYAALLSLARLHDRFLAQKIGATDPEDVKDLLPRIRTAVLQTPMAKTAWVLKHSVAKKLLKQCPPKQLMKYLGYKSLDSMLKREPVAELYAGIQLIESRRWFEKFVATYDSVTSMDFEVRDIEVLLLDAKRWEKAATVFVQQQRNILMHVRELGAVVMLPAPFERRAGVTITVLPQLLHYMNEIRLYTSFYKLHQMRPDLGHIIATSILHDVGNHFTMAGQQIHWRVAQRHFGKAGNHPEVLEPHVQPADLSWRKAEDTLFRMEPALHFWFEHDYVAALEDGKPLSFNLMDVALNYLNQLPYEHRIYSHFQDGLWNELFVRYLGEPALESAVLKQLDFEESFDDVLEMVMKGKR